MIFASSKNKFTNELHTNFKIKFESETILFSNPAGQVINQIDSTSISTDISLGRSINNITEWLFYSEPIPGTSNITPGYIVTSKEPQFSTNGGVYSSSLVVTLSLNSDFAKIDFLQNMHQCAKSILVL
ncbi:MAG: hypothetical protein GY936_16355 [Ignavibacteriae bacterium]|nr:hypothetical protein [Ignavibacteriota bacterium]